MALSTSYLQPRAPVVSNDNHLTKVVACCCPKSANYNTKEKEDIRLVMVKNAERPAQRTTHQKRQNIHSPPVVVRLLCSRAWCRCRIVGSCSIVAAVVAAVSKDPCVGWRRNARFIEVRGLGELFPFEPCRKPSTSRNPWSKHGF